MIVWLEDREDTVAIFRAFLATHRIEHKIVATPDSFVQYLLERWPKEPPSSTEVVFFIDIMLYGTLDLKTIGIDNAPTSLGNNTGFVFADRYLRAENSKWRNFRICFLTEREIDGSFAERLDDLKRKGEGEIVAIRKFSQSEFDKFTVLMKRWGLIMAG